MTMVIDMAGGIKAQGRERELSARLRRMGLNIIPRAATHRPFFILSLLCAAV